MAWTRTLVEVVLSQQGWTWTVKDIQNGSQLLLPDGAHINLYDTGTVIVQGKDSEMKSAAIRLFGDNTEESGISSAQPASVVTKMPKRVFVVYGRDLTAREQLELTLHKMHLEPIVLQNIAPAGDTIIEKLEELTGADFACVLLTPDDLGSPRDSAAKPRSRARQNVVLEMGMVLAKLGRHRVAILVKGDDLERPSDIDGLIYIPFSTHIDEAKMKLAANLQAAGFEIPIESLL